MIAETRRRAAIGAGIAALVLAAGVGGYLIGRPADSGGEAPQSGQKIL